MSYGNLKSTILQRDKGEGKKRRKKRAKMDGDRTIIIIINK